MTNNASRESPFGKGTNWHLNACVGDNGGPYNFAAYGIGYFKSGNFIAKHIIETSDTAGDILLDLAIYPLLYMYRHGCELMMKHFLYDKNDPYPVKNTHNLCDLWEKTNLELSKLYCEYHGCTGLDNMDISLQEELEEYLMILRCFILKLHEIDPDGQVSRFPESLERTKFLKEYLVINIEPLYDHAMASFDIFSMFIEGKYALEGEET